MCWRNYGAVLVVVTQFASFLVMIVMVCKKGCRALWCALVTMNWLMETSYGNICPCTWNAFGFVRKAFKLICVSEYWFTLTFFLFLLIIVHLFVLSTEYVLFWKQAWVGWGMWSSEKRGCRSTLINSGIHTPTFFVCMLGIWCSPVGWPENLQYWPF